MKKRKIYEITKENRYYPKQLLNIENSPEKIYAIGNIKLLQNKAIAIVGSRKNTEYGGNYTKKFAYQLSKEGITIISGLAIGIDTIAHKSAMYNKGNTIAVLGAGFNNIYPEENRSLFEEILENRGCIISEYSPETKVNKLNFPTRNRIISGISSGVLVAEARFRSGSAITARYAIKQKKPLFCIPNKIGETTGVGTNNLIKEGGKLVTEINDILIEIGEKPIDIKESQKDVNRIEKEILRQQRNKKYNMNSKRMEKIAEKQMSIYNLLKIKPMNINEISIRTGKSIAEINQKITLMEIEGLIQMCPGNIVKIKE